MCKKTWCLISALLTLAAFGGGVGVGFLCRPKQETLEARAARLDPKKAQPKGKPSTPPKGMRLKFLKEAQEMLESAGQPNVMLKFAGNRYIKFWAEIEMNGETRRILEVTSRPIIQFAGESPHDAGSFVWLRLRTQTPGKEAWRMRLRGKDGASFGNMEVYLFGRSAKAEIKSTRELLPAPVHKIPKPLPLDRPVCLMEAREISDKGERMSLGSHVALLGSAALANPLPMFAGVVTSKNPGICTIRLMCKVEPPDK
jgi:hypothetical protein